MEDMADIISRIPALQKLELEQASRVAQLFSMEHFAAGETIQAEGEIRDRLLRIQSGAVEILRLEEGKPAVPLVFLSSGK